VSEPVVGSVTTERLQPQPPGGDFWQVLLLLLRLP
jgi:hypothetical protein